MTSPEPLGKAETVSSLASQERGLLRLGHAGQVKEPLGAEQAVLEDGRDVIRVREMIKAIDFTHQATKPVPSS